MRWKPDNQLRALAILAKAGLLDDALRLLTYHKRPYYGYAIKAGIVAEDLIADIRSDPDHYLGMFSEYTDEPPSWDEQRRLYAKKGKEAHTR